MHLLMSQDILNLLSGKMTGQINARLYNSQVTSSRPKSGRW